MGESLHLQARQQLKVRNFPFGGKSLGASLIKRNCWVHKEINRKVVNFPFEGKFWNKNISQDKILDLKALCHYNLVIYLHASITQKNTFLKVPSSLEWIFSPHTHKRSITNFGGFLGS